MFALCKYSIKPCYNKKSQTPPKFSHLMWAFHALQTLQHPPYPSPSLSQPNLLFPPRTSFKLQSSSSSSSIAIPRSSISENNNKLIQSLTQKGNLKQAIQVLCQEPNPTHTTYDQLLLSCSRHKSLSYGLSVHRHIIVNGYDSDPYLATKLIDMYSELGSIENVRKVFDKCPHRTLFVWNAVFKALTMEGYGEEVLGLYRKMNKTKISSDRFTYTYVLKACVALERSVSLLDKGKEIHAHILRHGFDSRVHVMTTLVDMYARYGYVSHAAYLFDAMPEKNVVSWSAMIACYARNGNAFEALELFRKMMFETQETLPNPVTMVSVLQACSSLAALEQGKLIHGYILRKGLDSILPVISTLITMYARCGNLEMGIRVFDQMTRRDVVSWTSLISSYGLYGLGQDAIRVFNEMIKNGVSPTMITFISILGACSHAGLVEEGKTLFSSMVKKHNIYPSMEHYACMVDLLGRANKLNEAMELIENMRIEPGCKVWGSLLGSCRIHCNVELGEKACSRLFKLEPTNAGNYVLMADIYAESKMWDEVKRIRKHLDDRGLQKLAGKSWIEVNRKIYSFVSIDKLNPQIEQLYALLVELSMEMKEKGYVPETKNVLYDLAVEEKERILLGHSEKLALAFGLINSKKGETIRITKNLRLCEDCHVVTKFISKFANREILVRDVNRMHHFQDGVCSCGDYW